MSLRKDILKKYFESEAWYKEQKRYNKVQRAIEKKDKKVLDSYIDWFVGKSKNNKDWL